MSNKKQLLPICIIVCLISFVFLMGCTSRIYVTPSPQKVNVATIEEFVIMNDITIINDQPSTELMTFGISVGRHFQGRLNEFTDAVVESLSTELKQRGLMIAENANKTIKVGVTDAEYSEVGFRYKCTILLRVTTDSEYATIIESDNFSPAHPDRVCGGAITLAIGELFNDKKFIEYLRE